ncbi:MAG: DegT/DnrJ/EryC1/StrS aminotransferase family protein [Microthrixaceae bacterium]
MQFIDLAAQQARIRTRVDSAIAAVLDHGQYIMGPEVYELETELGRFCGAPHTVSCASGTDALLLALLARGVGPGDAVFVPSFTFAATAEVVALLGAVPVFVDIEPRYFNLDVAALEAAVEHPPAGTRPVGVIAVDLFGLPADYAGIGRVAEAHDVWVIADAAQSFGATTDGIEVGRVVPLTTTSFFPAKPLGCYGDGGAVFCEDPDEAARIRSLRIHGSGSHKYDNERIGVNGRLDTLQAAILLEKLRIFPDELALRDGVASRYSEQLADVCEVPETTPGCTSAWAQYTIRVDDRDAVVESLRNDGVPTAIYYPLPLHLQTAFKDFPRAESGLAVSENLAGRVLSLPMHPYLTEDDQATVVAAVRRAVHTANAA